MRRTEYWAWATWAVTRVIAQKCSRDFSPNKTLTSSSPAAAACCCVPASLSGPATLLAARASPARLRPCWLLVDRRPLSPLLRGHGCTEPGSWLRGQRRPDCRSPDSQSPDSQSVERDCARDLGGRFVQHYSL